MKWHFILNLQDIKAWESEMEFTNNATQKEPEGELSNKEKEQDEEKEDSEEILALGAPAPHSAWPSPNLSSLAGSLAKLQGKTSEIF